MTTPRAKFQMEVRNIRRFRHSCVSDLDVDDETISFTYTPPSMPGSPPLQTSVMIYTQNSPVETIVYLGSDERKFSNKMLHEIMGTILKGLLPPSPSLSLFHNSSLLHVPQKQTNRTGTTRRTGCAAVAVAVACGAAAAVRPAV